MKLVIGLVGEMGSGKATFIDLFKEIVPSKYSVGVEAFSKLLIETLNAWYIPLTRENIQNMPIAMVNMYGEGALTKAVYERVKNRKEDIIILDGVRWQSDLPMIKKFNKSLLVYITADLETRYERSKKRGQKVGESRATLEEFKKQHQAHTEIFISEIGSKADFKIINNDSTDEFKKSIKDFYNELVSKNLHS